MARRLQTYITLVLSPLLDPPWDIYFGPKALDFYCRAVHLQYIPYTHSPPCVTSIPSMGAPSMGMSKTNSFSFNLWGVENEVKLLK